MTTTDQPSPGTSTSFTPYQIAEFDLYRDVHKGIRAALFTMTSNAGRVDPGDEPALQDVATQVHSVAELLALHAEHEDRHVQPVLEQHLPELAPRIVDDHHLLEARLADLAVLADAAHDAPAPDRRRLSHRLYIELAAFTSAYLMHQDLEERDVMPALERAIGTDAAIAVHGQIIASIPPEEMMRSLALMLPAMNNEDRVEMLGGMRSTAPPEAFEAVWHLAGSLLDPMDHASLRTRLGID